MRRLAPNLHARLTIIAALGVLALAPSSAASGELKSFGLPSPKVHTSTPGGTLADGRTVPKVNVLLPEGYDPDAKRRYPVLWLLHGANGGTDSWVPDISELAAGLPAIIVMPDGGLFGMYTDWWNGGARGNPAWATYHLKVLRRTIERRYPIRTGRRWHAIGGISMGGQGTLRYAAMLPGYFGSAVGFSAATPDIQSEATQLGIAVLPLAAQGTAVNYGAIWGPPTGSYAEGNSPQQLAPNYRHTRLYLTSGNGVNCPGDPPTATFPIDIVTEAGLHSLQAPFAAAARDAGADVTEVTTCGVHTFGVWDRAFPAARSWGFFGPVPERPRSYKYEGVSPAGSHKTNTSIAQAYYNREAGVRKLATETGAGQWGSALALACELFGLECEVFMVGVSYDQKPFRRSMIETWGGTVHRSPSELTEAGRSQAEHWSGSLGIAISEAVEVAAKSDDTNYSLGSVLNHVCLHQTVIGQEAIAQLELAGEYPDVVVGCVGGGSNFAGAAYPFIRENLRSGKATRFLAAEPAACPTLTRGVYRYDYGDTVGLTPLMPMYTLGHDFVPPPVHAGGLRYHGDAPSLCALVKEEIVEPRAVHQTAAFDAAMQFARAEGIIPAPEPAHALRVAYDEAEDAKQAGEERVILINLCGHGHFDMSAYDAYLHGELSDLEFSENDMEEALARLPEAPVPA